MSRAKAIKGRIDNAAVLVGNPRFIGEEGIKLDGIRRRIEAHQARAETVVVVARNGEPVGIIAIADTLKGDAKEAIALLRSEGIATVMITGDNQSNRGSNRPRTRISIKCLPKCCRKTRRIRFNFFRMTRNASRLSATASMTRPRLRKPISASPSARGPISPSRPGTSCWSKAAR